VSPEDDALTGVEIQDVSPSEPDSDLLWGSSIDRPRGGAGGSAGATYDLNIEGWALGRRSPVVAAELVHDEVPLWRVPIELERPDIRDAYPDVDNASASGFQLSVGCLNFPLQFEVFVRAVLVDGACPSIATIRGRRPPIRSHHKPLHKPLIITTTGRTGSTALMRLLGEHPQIFTYRPFQHEPRVATYWLDVLRVLSEPASYLRQITHAVNLNDRRWWIGTRSPMPREIADREIQTWMGTDRVEAVATFCHSSIDAVYGQLADHLGQPGAVYFAEKYTPTVVPSLMWEIYPDAREVMLVRDFRDVIASILAFDAKRGFAGFDRQQGETDEESLVRLGRRMSRRLVESWQQRSDRAFLLRYEDLILHPADTLRALLRYLELDATPAVLDAMQGSLTKTLPETIAHRTTDAPEASIGRWRQDLSPELQRVCEETFGAALEAFGYEQPNGYEQESRSVRTT
jgi:hypothetical protein